MNLTELFGKGKPVLSFEIFPPKKNGILQNVDNTLEELKKLEPDFISVTYSAGGCGNSNFTLEIASKIKNEYGIEPLAHLTCINSDKQETAEILDKLSDAGIENILALRGDINPDIPPKNDFKYASELVSFIRERGNFGISGACYPEGHISATDIVEDTLNLRKKIEAGAEHLISQLFFDNSYFYAFLERVRLAEINVPIEAGIMPITSRKQFEKMVTMCGASLPEKYMKTLERYEDKPEALRDAGIAYAIEQIVDLISHGVDGIHLYTMNNPVIARKICEGIKSLRAM